MLPVHWSDFKRRTEYHPFSRGSIKPRRRKMRSSPINKSTQGNPTLLTQLVTPTETKKPNRSNLADVVEAIALVPANRSVKPSPNLPSLSYTHPPTLPFHPSIPTTSLYLSIPKRQMMPILQLIQLLPNHPCKDALAQRDSYYNRG